MLFWTNANAQSSLPSCTGTSQDKRTWCIGSVSINGQKYLSKFKYGIPYGKHFNSIENEIALARIKVCREKEVGSWDGCMGRKVVTSAGLIVRGDVYVGEFKGGKFNGKGRRIFTNGNTYVGEFKDDLRHGLGIEYLPSGLVHLSGEWKRDILDKAFDLKKIDFLFEDALWDFVAISLIGDSYKNENQKLEGVSDLKVAINVSESQALEVIKDRPETTELAIKPEQLKNSLALASFQGFGLIVADLSDAQKSQFKIKGGVHVEKIQEQAAESGLREGDVILAVGNIEVTQLKDFESAWARIDKSKPTSVLFRRNELTRFALIRMNQSGDSDGQRLLAEQKAKEQQRITEEARVKEQQRLALEASEISRLRADAEESKRKQAELEEQLRLAKLQNQVSPPSVMTTMANRKALVIGNDTYKSVTKLLNAREDAKAIASNLTAVGYKVTLQLDLNEKEMKAALRTFSSQVQGGDEVMFFFAGHGVQLGAANYLLPTDIAGESEAQVKDEAIQLQRVLDDMTEKKAKFTLAMIDACRDNPFKSTGRNIGGRGLAPTTAATGQMVVFSAGTGQQALDRLGNNDKSKNGVFTRTFLKEMQKPGVSIDRIVKNVRNEVAELAKTVGHEQVPAIYDQVLGDFYFKK